MPKQQNSKDTPVDVDRFTCEELNAREERTR
jgi:hypothetical protein